jgi:hypothetical protein
VRHAILVYAAYARIIKAETHSAKRALGGGLCAELCVKLIDGYGSALGVEGQLAVHAVIHHGCLRHTVPLPPRSIAASLHFLHHSVYVG